MGNACCAKTGPDTQALKESDKDTDEPKQSKAKPNKYVKSTTTKGAGMNSLHEEQGTDVNSPQEDKGAGVNNPQGDEGADVNVKKTADYVNLDAIQEIQKEEEEEDSAEEEYVNIPAEPDVLMSLQTKRLTRSNRDEIYAPISISRP